MSLGKNPVKIKGKARPTPMALKTAMIETILAEKAKVSAVPKKGALQGVDSTVAKIPETKSPTKGESVLTFPKYFPPGVENSKRPKRFSEKTKRAITIIMINFGDCN